MRDTIQSFYSVPQMKIPEYPLSQDPRHRALEQAAIIADRRVREYRDQAWEIEKKGRDPSWARSRMSAAMDVRNDIVEQITREFGPNTASLRIICRRPCEDDKFPPRPPLSPSEMERYQQERRRRTFWGRLVARFA